MPQNVSKCLKMSQNLPKSPNMSQNVIVFKNVKKLSKNDKKLQKITDIQQSAYVIYEWPHRKIFPVCPFTLDDLQFRRYLNDFAMVLTSYHELEKAECFKPVSF